MVPEPTRLVNNYVEPAFSKKNKLRRMLWNITWAILCSWTPNLMHAWRIMVLRMFGAKIGKQNFIYPDCKIWAPWLLETENTATIGPRVEVYNPGGFYLGHHAILSQDAYICGATHDYNSANFTYLKRRIVIEPYVWICAKAVVLPGVCCGEGSVLAAAAIATRDLDNWSVYAGNPAVKVKSRKNFVTQKHQ